MKAVVKIIFLAIVFANISFSQNSIHLVINQKLGEEAFEFNKATRNNMNHDFMVDRLEYYISEVSVIHDGGQETQFNDLWILANAGEQTMVDLGTANIVNTEEVRFHIGVDPEANHLDPTLYDPAHPLAPKSPSMHWGWSSGYRFVAIEGVAGVNFDQVFQVHALGDDNYGQVEVEINRQAENGIILLELDADYSKSMDNANIEWGLIEHSDRDEAVTILGNFHRNVFTETSAVSSSIDVTNISHFACYPNPSSGETIKMEFSAYTDKDYDLVIFDTFGKQVYTKENIDRSELINLKENGIYFLSITNNSKAILTKRLIVK